MGTVNASVEVSVEVDPDGGVHFPGRDQGPLPHTGLDAAPAALLGTLLLLLAVLVTAVRSRIERIREKP